MAGAAVSWNPTIVEGYRFCMHICIKTLKCTISISNAYIAHNKISKISPNILPIWNEHRGNVHSAICTLENRHATLRYTVCIVMYIAGTDVIFWL